MAKAKARGIVENLDSSKPFLSRFEFIEALAALSATFPEDMNRKVTGANKRVAHVVWCATDPDRAAWLFNNSRWRHSISLRLRCVQTKGMQIKHRFSDRISLLTSARDEC